MSWWQTDTGRKGLQVGVAGLLVGVGGLVVAIVGLWDGDDGPTTSSPTELTSSTTSLSSQASPSADRETTTTPPAAPLTASIGGTWTDDLGETWTIVQSGSNVTVETSFWGVGSLAGLGTFVDGRLEAELVVEISGERLTLDLSLTNSGALNGFLTGESSGTEIVELRRSG